MTLASPLASLAFLEPSFWTFVSGFRAVSEPRPGGVDIGGSLRGSPLSEHPDGAGLQSVADLLQPGRVIERRPREQFRELTRPWRLAWRPVLRLEQN